MRNSTKRFLSLAVATCMVLTAVPFAAFGFEDAESHWGKAAIDQWSEYGVINGYDDGTFKPDRNMTRAEFAKVLNLTVNYQKTGEAAFTDVTEADWFAEHINKLNAAGVMNGSNGLATPNANITRQEAIVMIARAFNIAENEAAADSFDDAADIASWAKGLVGGMKAEGYVQGSENKINPTNNITRAEAVTILNNMIGALYNKEGEYTADVEGMVVANVKDVAIKDSKIEGDVYVTEGVGDGDFTLDSATISGTLYLNGGGVNSIIIKGDTTVGKIVIEKSEEGGIRIKNEAGKDITDELVVFAGEADKVVIEGEFSNVSIEAEAVVEVNNAKIGEMDVKEGANVTVAGTTTVEKITVTEPEVEVKVKDTATVNAVEINADEVKITGDGTVKTVDVQEEAKKGVEVTTPATEVTIDKDAGSVVTGENTTAEPGQTVTTDGVAPSNEEGTSTSGGGSTGGSMTSTVVATKVVAEISNSDSEVALVGDSIVAIATNDAGKAATSVKYQWYVDVAGDGNKTNDRAIKGATGKTFVVTEAYTYDITDGTATAVLYGEKVYVTVTSAGKNDNAVSSANVAITDGFHPLITSSSVEFDKNTYNGTPADVVIKYDLGTGLNAAAAVTDVLIFNVGQYEVLGTANYEIDAEAKTITIKKAFLSSRIDTVDLAFKFDDRNTTTARGYLISIVDTTPIVGIIEIEPSLDAVAKGEEYTFEGTIYGNNYVENIKAEDAVITWSVLGLAAMPTTEAPNPAAVTLKADTKFTDNKLTIAADEAAAVLEITASIDYQDASYSVFVTVVADKAAADLANAKKAANDAIAHCEGDEGAIAYAEGEKIAATTGNLIAADAEVVTDVDAAIAAVETAVDNLKAALAKTGEAAATADELNALTATLTEKIHSLDDVVGVLQEAIDAARAEAEKEALAAAKIVAKETVDEKLDETSFVEANYTKTSWNAFTSAIATIKAKIDACETMDDLTAYMSAVFEDEGEYDAAVALLVMPEKATAPTFAGDYFKGEFNGIMENGKAVYVLGEADENNKDYTLYDGDAVATGATVAIVDGNVIVNLDAALAAAKEYKISVNNKNNEAVLESDKQTITLEKTLAAVTAPITMEKVTAFYHVANAMPTDGSTATITTGKVTVNFAAAAGNDCGIVIESTALNAIIGENFQMYVRGADGMLTHAKVGYSKTNDDKDQPNWGLYDGVAESSENPLKTKSGADGIGGFHAYQPVGFDYKVGAGQAGEANAKDNFVVYLDKDEAGTFYFIGTIEVEGTPTTVVYEMQVVNATVITTEEGA